MDFNVKTKCTACERETSCNEMVVEFAGKQKVINFCRECYSSMNLQNDSDGYHTFDELYHHRMILFSVICSANREKSWKSWKHSGGDMFEDYFIVGIDTPAGQYSYHYHKDNWDYFDVPELDFAPEWDGHQPKDVDRMLSLIKKKLYMVSIIDDTEFYAQLVVARSEEEAIKKIEESDNYSCIVHCSAEEVEEIDGHKIVLKQGV